MKRGHKIWNRIAKRYHRQKIADPASYKIKLQITREYLQPTMKIFEFGCGTGSTAIAHSPYVTHVDGIDTAPNMIEIARAQAVAQGIQNVSFNITDFDEFLPGTQTYDAVLGLNILHLVDDKNEAIAKVHTLLKPGGLFVSSTPCLGDDLAIFKWLGPIGATLGVLPTLRVFTLEELESSLTGAGFKIIHHFHPGKRKAVFIVAEKRKNISVSQ